MSGRRSLGDKDDEQPAPTVDGIPLGEGYGVSIEWDEERDDLELYPTLLPRMPRLVAWMTMLDARGEYQKVRQLPPRAVVEFDAEGKHVWFSEGVGRITTVEEPST